MIDAALLEKLKTYDTPTICNALEIVDPARRLTGFTVKPLVCPFPTLAPIVGYAKTATSRSTHAHELDGKQAREQRIAYYEYIASKPAPGIVIIQDLDGHEVGFGAFWGEVMSAVHKGLGCLGVVTDGSIRDIDQWAPGFQALAGSIVPSHAHVHLADFGKEVRVAGMLVRSGDLVHADRHGAVTIPAALADKNPGRLRSADPQGGRHPRHGPRAGLQHRQAARGAGQARRDPLSVMKHRVIVIQPIHAEGMQILHARDDLEVIVPDNPDPATWSNFLPGTEALCVRLSKIPRSLIEAAPDLKIISRHGVGCDNIDVGAATDNGVVVATVGLANAPSVVEHTLALMLALAKRLFDVDRDVRGGDYMRKLQARGAGHRRPHGADHRPRAHRQPAGQGAECVWASSAWASIRPIRRPRSKRWAASRSRISASALPRADFVTLHTPLQDDTRNLIGARELAMMKPTAYLINCARGGIVDEKALVEALDAGASWVRRSTCRSTSRPSRTIRCSNATA